MAYKIDPFNNDVVIGDFQNGIGDSPYVGFTDMRSVDPTSIPGEVSIAYKTISKFSCPIISSGSGSLITDSGGLFSVARSLLLEENQFVTFSNLGGATGSNLAINTAYQLIKSGASGLNELFTLFRWSDGAQATVTGAGTATFSTINPTKPNYFDTDGSYDWMIDDSGRLWSNKVLTTGSTSNPATGSWTWMKNDNTSGHGNGLVCFQTPNSGDSLAIGDKWVFVFRDSLIDYAQTRNTSGTINPLVWVYGWNPNTAGTGVSVLQNTIYHQAIVAPDGNLYFLNSSNNSAQSGSIGKIQVNWPVPGFTAFNPVSAPSTTNYSYADFPIIPKGGSYNLTTCMEPSGTDIVIGGQDHFSYTWDTVNRAVRNYTYYAETNIVALVTANQNTYAFVGNRGNIYITNGSQAQVWTKVPDHIASAGTLPVFTFYGAAFQKGRIYFGMDVTSQFSPNTSANTIGGVWAIDLQTKALWCTNQLSYGTYQGYASCFLARNETSITPNGNQLLIGWYDGVSKYGIDQTTNVPYSGTQAYITSDLMPIGTYFRPNTPSRFEYKLSKPLLTNESISLSVIPYVDGTETSLGTTNGSTAIIISDVFDNTTTESQWIAVKATLASSSTLAMPSYVRLNQLRITGEKMFGQI